MRTNKIRKNFVKILICLCILIILPLTSLFIVSGIFVPKDYLKPWKKTYAGQFQDPRIRIAAQGLLAANSHNMQPWKIQLDQKDSKIFYLFTDSQRLTPEVDPYARQIMITQGTFLEYVSIAAGELGYQARIDLFPNGTYEEDRLLASMDNKPVAKITLIKDVPINNSLYKYMFLPDTNRSPYKVEQLSERQITELESISMEDITVKVYENQEDIRRLGDYAISGAAAEAKVERVMEETQVIFRANEFQKNKYRYGFSVEGQGTSGMMRHIMQGMVTLFPSLNQGKTASDLFIKSTREAVKSTAAYVIISSKDNSRKSQVKSGLAYSKLILTAHGLGLAMQPLSQVLEEYLEMQALYEGIHRDYAKDGGTIQMLVRIGKATKKTPLTMRRDVSELIVDK